MSKASSGSATIKRERPLSPHLQVYNLPLTARTSVLHRATGVALMFGLLMFAWWLIAAAYGEAAYNQFTDFAGSPLGLVLLLGWTASFYYHLANGLRHLVWDAGLLFTKKEACQASWFVLVVTAVLTGGTWLCFMNKLGMLPADLLGGM